MPVHIPIRGLSWDESADDHITNRLATDSLEDFIERGDFFVFPNTKGQPPGRFKLIGRMPSGRIWTVILEEPADQDPEHWKPITSWQSRLFEVQLYNQANRSRRRKGGSGYV